MQRVSLLRIAALAGRLATALSVAAPTTGPAGARLISRVLALAWARSHSRSRLAALLPVAVLASAAAGAAVPSGAGATEAVRYLDCRLLAGAGSYSSPTWVGAITQPTVVYGCPPLTSGSGYNVRYFAFSLPQSPTAESFVMTYYESGSAGSGVHPRLAWGASTVKGSRSAQYYNDGSIEGFYHSMADLSAGGSWRLGAEKLSSPIGSTQTAWHNIIFVP